VGWPVPVPCVLRVVALCFSRCQPLLVASLGCFGAYAAEIQRLNSCYCFLCIGMGLSWTRGLSEHVRSAEEVNEYLKSSSFDATRAVPSFTGVIGAGLEKYHRSTLVRSQDGWLHAWSKVDVLRTQYWWEFAVRSGILGENGISASPIVVAILPMVNVVCFQITPLWLCLSLRF
jgi:hypothetical protein